MPRRGNDTGTTFNYPLRVKYRPTGQTQEFNDSILNQCPRLRLDRFYDFAEALETYELRVPVYDVTNDANTILVGADSRGRVRVPRAGRLVAVQLLAEDALATHGTNHITVTITNELASGSGTTEMLSTTTGANSTDSDLASAVAVSAKIGRPFTVSGTAASLRVAEGDFLLITVTVGGTLANAVDLPLFLLTFATVPTGLTPRTVHTAGSPLIAPSASTAAGEVVLQLSGTSEANVAALDWTDQLTIDPTKEPIFSCRAKVSGVAASTRMIFGLSSAYNATYDSIVSNAWFRLEGASLALLSETDDGTTDSDDQSTGITLVADTYYIFTVDMSQGTGRIRFFVDDQLGSTIHSASAWTAASLMQPFIAIQKSTGTGTESITVDWIRISQNRI